MTEANVPVQAEETAPQPTDVEILKCRDDHKPVVFSRTAAPGDEQKPFQLAEGASCSWMKQEEMFGTEKLRPRIEPWLTALFQSEHLSILAGSGLTHAVHWLAQEKQLPGMATAEFSVFKEQIESAVKESAQKAGRGDGNIEDQIRVVNELLVGLEHYAPDAINFWGAGKLKGQIATLKKELTAAMQDFAASILAGEKSVAVSDPIKRADVAGLHLIDRFVGSITPVFRSSRLNIDMHYNPPGIRGEPRYLEGVARFCKLHGSVDWVETGEDIKRLGLPFGCESIDPFLKAPGLSGAKVTDVMIYPNAAKDRETATYPYVELFRDFAAAVCRPNSTLVVYGYSFGDDHINRVIRDMLTIPSTHLVIISRDDPMGRIMQTCDQIGRPAQTTLLIGKHLGDLQTLVDHYMPKPAIDKTTFKMADLLKARFDSRTTGSPDQKAESGGLSE